MDIERIVREVAELPDRTSPDDQPEMMLVSADELRSILSGICVQVPDTSALVDRFLAWPLPKSVCSDGCVTDASYKFPRSGTNLLTADEARQMMEYLCAPMIEALRHANIELSMLVGHEGEIPSDMKAEIRKTLNLIDGAHG